MGIQGLLPNLKSVTRRIHVSQLKGKNVAVDAYCLLHKGAYTCARELVEGVETDKYVVFCMNRIDVLVRHGVVPYVVFDGGPLPNKKEEEESRAQGRREQREKARRLWAEGSKAAAMECYQRAVDITPEIANRLVQELKQRNIRFLVAPYEADAQCAYLAHNGLVDAVLTEDSDLLAYGCQCVLYKFDANGEVDLIQFADLAHCRDMSFVGWNVELFQEMCVMAGCDFVKALPGIGIKKAHAHIRRTRHIMKALRAIKFDGVSVPAGYEAKIQRALWTFRHQRVFCPIKKQIVHLREIPEDGLESTAYVKGASLLVEGEPDFLGKEIPQAIAHGIARGDLHPFTYESFVYRTGTEMSHGRNEFQGLLSQKSYSQCNLASHSHMLSNTIQSSASARREYKRPRTLGEISDGSIAIDIKNKAERTASYSNGPMAHRNKQLGKRPLKSLKEILSSALHSNDQSSNPLDTRAEEIDEKIEGNRDTTAMKSPETVERERIPGLFTPIWRPTSCASSGQDGEPLAHNEEMFGLDIELDKDRNTPGIYLSENENLNSPENRFMSKSTHGWKTSPPGVVGGGPNLDHIQAVREEACAAVDSLLHKVSFSNKKSKGTSAKKKKTRKRNDSPNTFAQYQFE